MTRTSLGHKLRVLRAERGLTLREAASSTGVAKETISDIERDIRHPHDVTLSKLAKGYGVPVEDLLEEPVLAGKAEAPEETGQLSASDEAAIMEGLAAAVDSVADRIENRSAQVDEETDGEALVALFEDAWLAQRGADQLLEEVNEQAMRKQRETPGERRARSKLEDAVTRLVFLAENTSSGLLEGVNEQEQTHELAKVLSFNKGRRSRRAG